MPFLENFISTISHQSLLEFSATIENEQFDLPSCLPAIDQSIKACQERGLSPGQTIELVGASESAASFVMTQLAQDALKKTESHVLYIDLEGHYRLEHDQIRFHLFYGKLFVYRLASWLESHADIHVGWVMVDGSECPSALLIELRKLQQKWAFVLVITSTSSLLANFRFQVILEPALCLRMIHPLQLDSVAIV